MHPLQSNQRVLMRLCIIPGIKTTNTDRFFYSVYTIVGFSSILAVFISSLIFFIKFIQIDLETALFAVWQINGFMTALYGFVVMFSARQQVQLTFETLSNIYRDNQSNDSFHFLEQANNTCEWVERVWYKVTIVAVASIATISGLSVMVCKLIYGVFDTQKVFHPMTLALPFNPERLIGYFGEVLFEVMTTYAYFIVNGMSLLLFFSICWHHRAFSQMFHHTVQKINCQDRNRNDKKIMYNLIRFHVSAKGWFFDTAKLFSPNIAIQLVCNMFCLSCVVFQFELQSKHIDFSVWILLMAFQMGLLNLFVYCYFGKIATDSFLQMGDSLYDVNWQELPIALQKYVILMIGNMHRPLHYHGCGIAILNLETFGKLIKTVFTYYMLFKTITSD